MYKYENTFDMLVLQMSEYIMAIQKYKLNPINPKQIGEILRVHNLTKPLMYSAEMCISELCHQKQKIA